MSTGTVWPHPALAPGRFAVLPDRWPTGTRAQAGACPPTAPPHGDQHKPGLSGKGPEPELSR